MVIAYSFIAIIVMFLTWPFLWESPVSRFLEVLQLMSDNPTTLSVLFGGDVYRAGELPRRYLPFMLATTLTEPVWPLFGFGVFVSYWKLIRNKQSTDKLALPKEHRDDVSGASGSKRRRSAGDEAVSSPSWRLLRLEERPPRNDGAFISLTLTLLWFILLVAYVLIRRPSMYDGLRHFLFILPPVFIFTGFAFEFLFQHIALNWLRAAIVLAILFPGLAGIFKLHPYEYTYYNSLIGGTSHAFRNYETDYWLTCYKEAVEAVDKRLAEPFNLYVHREAYIADYYADAETNIHELRGAIQEVKSGDYVLVNTRTNEDRRVFKDAEAVLQIGRGNAVFCVIKRIP